MVQIMPQPFKHPKTRVCYLRKVIPVVLREPVGKTDLRKSLKIKGIREATRLYPKVALKVDAQLVQAAQGNSPIPYRAHLPGFSIGPGWMRLSNWIYDFSSIDKTTAWAGGFI